jgi:hypothetical protein
MSFWNIIIGTGILWLLTGFVVMPLAQLWTNSRAKKCAESDVSGQGVIAQTKTTPEIDTSYYIIVDVLVLGLVGLVMGLVFGWYFIGITWQAKSWPGMIALIGASIAGAMMHGSS